jgi:hypothetical protein
MHTLDSKQYLRELIDHYDLILSNEDSPLNIYSNIIKEEKYRCLHRLRKIREADLEGMIMGNVSAFQSHITS